MNRDTCKYIAILTMICNHIARMFLTPGNFLYESLSDIGYFAAMTMCYFLWKGIITREAGKIMQEDYLFLQSFRRSHIVWRFGMDS